MHLYIKLLGLGLSLGLLNACGGSSSSSNGAQYPVNDSVSAFMQMDHNYELRSVSNTGGAPYTMRVSWKAGGMQSFNGTPAFTTTRTMTIFVVGTQVSKDVTTDYFLLGPYKKLGSIDSSNSLVTLASNQSALPDFAAVGQSGDFDVENAYPAPGPVSSGGPAVVRTVNTWQLQSGPTAINARFFEDSAINGEAAMPTTESSGYQIDAKGNVQGVIVTLPVNGLQVTFSDVCTSCD
jgi:hypothetical protein